MQKLIIKGKKILSGAIKISGSKNATLPILAAAILTNKPLILKNIPLVQDVYTMINLLKFIGLSIEISKKKNKLNIYGEGGSMDLTIVSISENKNKINQIFDGDPSKLNQNFPGTKKKILANNKIIKTKNFLSISNYNLKKKNNLNIQKL